MKETLEANRRKVLKTLAGGAVGGTILTGSASASTANLTIDLVGDAFNFNPRRATIDVSGGGSKTVRWEYVTKGGPGHKHDVTLAESNSLGTVHTHSADMTSSGEFYEVTFSKDGDNLVIDESDGLTGTDENPTLEGALSDGDETIAYVCSYHAKGMYGHLKVKG